jgi:hypothetical protein
LRDDLVHCDVFPERLVCLAGTLGLELVVSHYSKPVGPWHRWHLRRVRRARQRVVCGERRGRRTSRCTSRGAGIENAPRHPLLHQCAPRR